MKSEMSRQLLIGSDLPQHKLVDQYAKALSKDRDPMYFDDRILDLVRIYLREGYDIDEVIAQADSIHYTTSKYEYAKIEEQILRFASDNHPYFGWNKNYIKAFEYLFKEMSNIHLSTLLYHGNEDIMDSLPKKDTHAGSDYLVTGKRKKGEYAEDIYTLCLKAEKEALANYTFGVPLMIGSRTQASMPYDHDGLFTGKFNSKTRLVLMVALRTITTELRWAKPLQRAMCLFPWYAGGKNDNALSVMMNEGRIKGNWLSVDYSGFDQSISNWLIHDVFKIIESMFRRDPNHDSKLFWIMVKDFCNKELIDGNGELKYSKKGVPSGSMFTQIIDTLVNRLMILTYLFSKGIDPRQVSMCIMGDDNIIFSRYEIDRDDLAGYLNKNFGVTVNNTKSSFGTRSDDPEFLSRSWSTGGAYRQWKHLILKLLYPERFRSYNDGKAIPELILYSYMLSYPVTMRKIFNMDKFHFDFPNLQNIMEEEGVAGLSGHLNYSINYLKVVG